MRRFWQRWNTRGSANYDLRKVISRQLHNEYPTPCQQTHIICDIDKTYLETHFESVLQLMKIPFESARDKVTVAGATDFLMALRWGCEHKSCNQADYPRSLHFVSSSPPQLRSTLQRKLRFDGLDWDSETFKNQAYNLLKGRMDLLKQHVGYKTLAILDIITTLPDHAKIICIGDNAESDALIYIGVGSLLSGNLSTQGFFEFLKTIGMDPAIVKDFFTIVEDLPNVKMANVLIRRAPGYDLDKPTNIDDFIQTFDDYFEAALILFEAGFMDVHMIGPLALKLHNYHRLPRLEIICGLLRAQRHCPNQSTSWMTLQGWIEHFNFEKKNIEDFPTHRQPRNHSTSFLENWTEENILDQAKLWIRRQQSR